MGRPASQRADAWEIMGWCRGLGRAAGCKGLEQGGGLGHMADACEIMGWVAVPNG